MIIFDNWGNNVAIWDLFLVIHNHYILCQEKKCRCDNMSHALRQFVIW